MSAKKITLDHFRELLKSELPRPTQLAAGTALGTGGTLLMAGNLSAGLMRVYNQNSAHRWFWEDHVTLGLYKLRQQGLLADLPALAPNFAMYESEAMRYLKRSDWYSKYPLTVPVNQRKKFAPLEKPTKIPDAPPLVYVALGDSAAQGVGVEDVRDSYVALFASYLRRATRRRIIVLNISISGAVASTVINTQLPQLLSWGLTPDIITFDIGGNDTFMNDGLPIENFTKQLEIITDTLPVPALIAEVPTVRPLPQDRRSLALNNAVHSVVDNSIHTVVPLRKLGEVPLWKTLSIRAEDGFHPNADTYRLTALEFARCVQPLLIKRGWLHDTAENLDPQPKASGKNHPMTSTRTPPSPTNLNTNPLPPTISSPKAE